MGKFTDWMMKGMGGDDDYSRDRSRRGRDETNYDRYVQDGERSTVDYGRAPEYQPREDARSTVTVSSPGSTANQNVVLYSPKSFEDVQTLIDYLKRHEPAVVDLAGVADASAQRILDFLSGAIYALSGSIHRISGSIFLLTPSGVNITVPSDIKSRLEGKK